MFFTGQNKVKIFLTFVLIAVLAIFVFLPALTQAQGIKDAIKGLNESASKGFLDVVKDDITEEEKGILINLPGAIGRIIGAVLSLLGVIFLILMIYGGFIWMTARGNETKVTEAKDLITSALIGLIIVLAAYAITAFVGSQLTTSP